MSEPPDTSAPTLADIPIVIPARRPDSTLPALIQALRTEGLTTIVLVDDGSPATCAPIFAQAEQLKGIHVLRHAANLGKGRALKTGIHYCLNTFPHSLGLITADADGQHTPPDILRIAQALAVSNPRPILGSRAFVANVPLRSRFGNALTRTIFAFVTGARLADTQTGLRAFPRALLPELLTLEGERYEYEMSVLLHLCRAGRRPIEIPIQTVYTERNRTSHFRPIRDSMRIYSVLAHGFLALRKEPSSDSPNL
jgi:glycosyltransferase involved in cell wall biosynthesis